MMSFLVSIFVIVVGFWAISSLSDENRKIPSISTPEGKKARIVGVLVIIASIGALTLNIISGEGNPRLMIISILIGAGVVFVPLLQKRWKKDKQDK